MPEAAQPTALATRRPVLAYFMLTFVFSWCCALAAAMTAMRVLIAWIYVNPKSVLLSQLMHIRSTSSLVVLSPARISALLWLSVALIVLTHGKTLTRQSD